MYINRIILRDVRNFKHLDITLRNDWTEQHLKSVLFTGPNGSGKSTVLEVITVLWESLKDYAFWVDYRQGDNSLTKHAGFCAIELCNFGHDTDFNTPITG